MEIPDQLKLKNKSILKIKLEAKEDKKIINNKMMNWTKIINHNYKLFKFPKIFKIKTNNNNNHNKLNKYLLNPLLFHLKQLFKWYNWYKYLNNFRINNNNKNRTRYLVILN